MAQISLVFPTKPGQQIDMVWVDECRRSLMATGHVVELIQAWASDGREPVAPSGDTSMRQVEATMSGLGPAAMAGLESANGEFLVLLDAGMAYDSNDVVRVVQCLLDGEAELVFASRFTGQRGGVFGITGKVGRTIFGTSDPLSGLVGLSRDRYEKAAGRFSAVGSKFSFEILSKSGGPIHDMPVVSKRSIRRELPSWDDVRHWKRLADHRFGNASRLLQFCTVGASGMVIDLSLYALFQFLLDKTSLANYVVPPTKIAVSLALARALAVAVALVWNFSLNRRLTFNDSRGGSILHQFITYVLSNGVGLVMNLGLSLGLPRKVGYFNDHKLLAAFVAIVAATGVNFTLARWFVFRRAPDKGSHETDMGVGNPLLHRAESALGISDAAPIKSDSSTS